jgi:xylulokinase
VPLVLGVGSDAAGTAVEVRDVATGRLVATGEATHPAPVDGTQPAEVWWDGMVDAIAACGRGRDVAAVAVAGQRQALVLLDGAGAPIVPASLRSDPVAASSAAALATRLGPAKLARSTGQVPRADSPLARLAAMVDGDRHLPERMRAMLGATELLTFRLTGRLVADRSSASATGWWSPATEQWRVDLLDRIARPGPPGGWGAVLPEVVAPAAVADQVRATVHVIAGLTGRPLVAAGADDLMARVLAAGLPPGSAGLLLDADAAVVALTDAPANDPTGHVQSFADATGRHLPTVGVLPIGPMLDGIATLLGTDAHGLAALAATVEEHDPESAPVVVGFHRGAPGDRPAARPGALLHLDEHHGPGDVALAALHAVATELLVAAHRIHGDDDAPLIIAGGDAAWPGLAEAIADLAGRSVIVGPSATAMTGACVLAAAALEGADPLEVAATWQVDGGTEVEPSGTVDGELTMGLIRTTWNDLKSMEVTE